MNLTLLVMAAGMGSRFGGLKQVEPVGPNGETLLDYSVFDAQRAGFRRVVFVLRRDFEDAFRRNVGGRFEKRLAVSYLHQEFGFLPAPFKAPAERSKPWGTGHAVWSAREVMDGPFVVINADDFYGRDPFEKLAGFLDRPEVAGAAGPAKFAMAGYELSGTLSESGAVSRGVCSVDEEGRLERIAEQTGIEAAPAGAGRVRLANGHERLLPPDAVVSMNCWGFTPELFPILDEALVQFLDHHGTDAGAEFGLPSIVGSAIDQGQAIVDVLPVHASWFGLTRREDIPRVAKALGRLVAAGEYPSPLWT